MKYTLFTILFFIITLTSCTIPAKEVKVELEVKGNTTDVMKDSTITVLKARIEGYLKQNNSKTVAVNINCNGNTIIVNIGADDKLIDTLKANNALALKTLLTMPARFQITQTYKNNELAKHLLAVNEYLKENNIIAKLVDSSKIDDLPQYDLSSILLDAEPYNGASIGIARREDTALINKIFKTEVKTLLPPDLSFKWKETKGAYHYGLKYNRKTIYSACQLTSTKLPTTQDDYIDNSMIEQVKVTNDGVWDFLTFTLKQKYHNRWKQLTANNINKQLAIIIDGKVMADPNVVCEIESGMFSMNGDSDNLYLNILAAILNGGALPLPLTIKSIK